VSYTVSKLKSLALSLLFVLSIASVTITIAEGNFRVGDFSRLSKQFAAPSEDILILTIQGAFNSLMMSVVGATIGIVFALVGAALLFHLRNRRLVFSTFNAVLVFARTIPDLVIALMLVAVLGIGPQVGALTLALGSFAVMTTMTLDATGVSENAHSNQLIRSGVPRWKVFALVLVPESWQELLKIFLFRLEIMLRLSAYLGIIGAGGLGQVIYEAIANFRFTDALIAISVLSFIVLGLEAISQIFSNNNWSLSKLKSFTSGLTIFCSISVVILFIQNPLSLSASRLSNIIARLLKPDFESYAGEIVALTIDSVAIAITATSGAFIIGLTLAFLAARKFSPLGRVSRPIFLGLFSGLRSVPIVVWAIVLVIVVGFGVQAGLMASILGLSLFFGKYLQPIFSRASFPETDALLLQGGSKFVVFLIAAFYSLRSATSSALALLADVAVRYSVVLGLVGAGGIGSLLLGAAKAFDYETLSATLIVVVVVIVAIRGLILQRSSGALNGTKF
jgi:phosphonate transport system permease protein